MDKLMKDPFDTPMEMKASGAMDVAMRALLRSAKIDADVVKPMLASPASNPKSVLDAEALGICLKCKQKVWISPSAFSVYKKCHIFCMDCFLKQLQV